MIRRIVASYLKKLADLEDDFAAERRRREEERRRREEELHHSKVDKWEEKRLDELDPERVLHRRVKDLRDKSPSRSWLDAAVKDPTGVGLDLLQQRKIQGDEPEFVEAVTELIEKLQGPSRERRVDEFLSLGVPIRHLVQSLSTEEARERVFNTKDREGPASALIDLLIIESINQAQAKELASEVVKKYPQDVRLLNSWHLLNLEEARKYYAIALPKVRNTDLNTFLIAGRNSFQFSRAELLNMINNIKSEKKKKVALEKFYDNN